MKKNVAVKGLLVAVVKSKDGARKYEVRKIATGNWFCTCGQNGRFPCKHKFAAWKKGRKSARVMMVEPRALKNGWMGEEATA